MTLNYANGSIGTILYTAAGDKGSGKERVEVFGGGRSASLDDYRELSLVKSGKSSDTKNRLRQDKGHNAEWVALKQALRDGSGSPISLASWVATSLATFAAVESLHSGQPVDIDVEAFIASARAGSSADDKAPASDA